MRKLNASLMIMLMVLIPVYSSAAFAQSVEITRISGADDVGGEEEGFRRVTDTIEILTTVTGVGSLSTNEILAEIDGVSGWSREPQSCTAIVAGSEYECSWEIDQFETNPDNPPERSRVFLMRYYPGGNTQVPPLEQDIATLYVDMAGPTASLDAEHVVVQEDINLTYTIEDHLVTGDDVTDTCAGIDRVEFYKNDLSSGNFIESVVPPTDPQSVRCKRIDVSYELDLSNEDGAFSLCAIGFDTLGQPVQPTLSLGECIDVFVDNDAPSVDSLIVTYAEGPLEGEPATALTDSDVLVDINIEISDIEIGTDLGEMTLEELRNNMQASFPNIHPNPPASSNPTLCTEVNDTITCTWENVEMRSDQSINPVADYSVVDAAGNVAQGTLTGNNMMYVAEGPQLSGMQTSWGIGSGPFESGFYYLGPDNIITVDVNPGGSLNPDSIALDLSRIDSFYEQFSSIPSDDCSNSPRVCTFNLTEGKAFGTRTLPALDENDGEDVTIFFRPDESEDSLGLLSMSPYQQQFTIDVSSPIVTDVDVRKIPGSASPPGPSFVEGDSFEITMQIEDTSILTGYLDVSGIVQGSGFLTADCTQLDETSSECVFGPSPPINVQTYANVSLNFSLTDRVGLYTHAFNGSPRAHMQEGLDASSGQPVYIEILERNDTAVPNFWEVRNAECSGPFDRVMASLIPLPVYCSVEIGGVGDSLLLGNPTKIVTQECYASDGGNDHITYLDDPLPVGLSLNDGDPNFYLSMKLDQGDVRINTLDITCPVQIFTRYQTQTGFAATTSPEEEFVNFSISFFNNPLGEYSNEVIESIEDTKNIADNALSVIRETKEVLDFAQGICNLMNTWNTVIGTLSSIAGIIYFIPGAQGAAEELKGVATDLSISEANSFLGNREEGVGGDVFGTAFHICNYLGCKHGLWNAQEVAFGNPDQCDQPSSLEASGAAGSGEEDSQPEEEEAPQPADETPEDGESEEEESPDETPGAPETPGGDAQPEEEEEGPTSTIESGSASTRGETFNLFPNLNPLTNIFPLGQIPGQVPFGFAIPGMGTLPASTPQSRPPPEPEPEPEPSGGGGGFVPQAPPGPGEAVPTLGIVAEHGIEPENQFQPLPGESQAGSSPTGHVIVNTNCAVRDIEQFTGTSLTPDPKSSLAAALWQGCIPGLIENIDRLRQIECNYGRCLIASINDGTAYETNQDAIPGLCRASKDYAYCKFVVGEAINLFPFVASFQKVFQKFGDLVSDPLGLVGGGALFACQQLSRSTPAPAISGCLILGHSFHILEVVNQLINIESQFNFDTEARSGVDHCEKFNEEYDEVFG